MNLVGILNTSVGRGGTFEEAHLKLAENIIAAATKNNNRIIQVSSLNADAENGPSEYLRTKGKAADLLILQQFSTACPVACLFSDQSYERLRLHSSH